MPAIRLRQQAAERRAHDGTKHHGAAPDRHDARPIMQRVIVQHGRLRERHERRPEGALQQAKEHDLLDILGEAAEERSDREAGHEKNEKPLAAEPARHPSDRRSHDGGGDDVGCQHPVDLIDRRRQTALHVGKRHIRDGLVEGLHDARRHHADRDQGPPRAAQGGAPGRRGVHAVNPARQRRRQTARRASAVARCRCSPSCSCPTAGP